MNIGDRVGAVQFSSEKEVKLFGYGVYLGDTIPDVDQDMRTMLGTLASVGLPNPTIKLDNGKTVYGCECWWTSEDKVKSMIGDRTATIVDVDEARK